MGLTTMVLLALVGCKNFPEGLPSGKALRPDVEFRRLRIDAIDFTKVDTTFVLAVENPWPVTLPVERYDWTLELADSRFASGKSDEGIRIEGNGSSKVRIPVSATFAEVFEVAEQTRGIDAVPFRIRGDLGFDTPVGAVTVPFDATGDFPALRAPKFKPTAVRVEKLDLARQTARIAVDVAVTSDQKSTLSFPRFGYQLSLAGKQVATGDAAVPAVDEEASFTLPVDVNLAQLGSAAVSALSDRSQIEVGLGVSADVETPFGVVPLAVTEKRSVSVR